jgi:hypothetical protein
VKILFFCKSKKYYYYYLGKKEKKYCEYRLVRSEIKVICRIAGQIGDFIIILAEKSEKGMELVPLDLGAWTLGPLDPWLSWLLLGSCELSSLPFPSLVFFLSFKKRTIISRC